jgi:arsenate reductase (thioredoxin)
MHRKINVLFVSRRNTLRSIMAQACLTHIAEKRFHARSCGLPLRVGTAVDPAAVSALRTAGIPLPDIKPRSWNEFVPARGFEAEFVIALDADIERLQPAWPGQPHTALWAYPDTAVIDDPEEAAHKALQILYSLRRRLELLASLPLYGSDRESVRADIRDLGYMA